MKSIDKHIYIYTDSESHNFDQVHVWNKKYSAANVSEFARKLKIHDFSSKKKVYHDLVLFPTSIPNQLFCWMHPSCLPKGSFLPCDEYCDTWAFLHRRCHGGCSPSLHPSNPLRLAAVTQKSDCLRERPPPLNLHSLALWPSLLPIG